MNMVAIGKLPELLRFHAITRYDVLFRGSAAKEMSLFAEMRRRNVVRVGIAYIVIGWLLAQIASSGRSLLISETRVADHTSFLLLQGILHWARLAMWWRPTSC